MNNNGPLTPNQQYNQSIVEEYLESQRLESLKNKASPLTIRTYRYQLKTIINLDKKINELTYEDVKDLINSKQHLKKRTRMNFISTLSSLFTFCVKKGYMSKVLIKKRWRIKPDKLLPKPLSRIQRAELRVLAEEFCDRDRAIIELLLSSGCRVNEASQLNVGDFDFEHKKVIVLGKRSKKRPVYFSDTAAMLLRRISQGRDADSPMFVNKYGNRLSNRGIYSIVNCAGLQMETIDDYVGPHRLRHTFGSHQLSNGADLVDVANDMGHVDVQTTLGYAKNLDEDLIIKFHKRMG